MKLEHNWRFKTLEHLEKDVWGPDTYGSRLTSTIHQLRKKVLNDYTVEDLRITIGQQMGLPYLVPLAIEVLKENLFAEGDFYEGDLLKAVLTIDGKFWKDNGEYWNTVHFLIKTKKQKVMQMKIDTNIFYTNKP
ncbi:MAG: contact-dependent growth inhibition system immunity protein [Mucilaginibacter sp.]